MENIIYIINGTTAIFFISKLIFLFHGEDQLNFHVQEPILLFSDMLLFMDTLCAKFA